MSKRRGKAASLGALRHALLEESLLKSVLQPGLQALGSHASRIDDSSARVTDSLDFDAATRSAAPQTNRWDYFLGAGTRGIVGVEVHSATDGEVSVVIAKKRHSKPEFQAELRSGAGVARWVWLASGKVKFSPNSRYLRLLAQNQIEFEGRRLKL